ncbi:putative n utilization substance protein B [Mycobacterium ulcerans str. Harvey]|uniref:N utilization substance protein B n=1 Tax=Mycobacterium ulcerans str. Harvey TaxID=1299332 RepID=A0ABP3AJ58_MYCUL|nr:putative n utilization substance protein B [Mycobacterium ulcerans str. Harvey]
MMAAIMGLTQAVVRALGDVTDLPARRWELPQFPQLPVLRWVDSGRETGGSSTATTSSKPDRTDRTLKRRGQGEHSVPDWG